MVAAQSLDFNQRSRVNSFNFKILFTLLCASTITWNMKGEVGRQDKSKDTLFSYVLAPGSLPRGLSTSLHLWNLEYTEGCFLHPLSFISHCHGYLGASGQQVAPKQHRHHEEPGSTVLQELTLGVPTASQTTCPCRGLEKYLASTSYPSNEWGQPPISSSIWWHPSPILSIPNSFHASLLSIVSSFSCKVLI